MNILKCLGGALAGGATGLFLGVILYVPSCIAGGVLNGTPFDERISDAAMPAALEFANRFFLLCVVGGPLIGFFQAFAKERARLAGERKAARECEKAEQASIHSSLVRTTTNSLTLFEKLPSHLITAEEFLNQAERDFKEGAFSPFWSSIEQATKRLGAFDDSVRTITKNSSDHIELAKRYKGGSPRFPLDINSVHGMAAAGTTTERLKAIVRRAQCNFQFATIYEQRKTNQLLTAGFTTLAQALDGMGRRIASSIDDLQSEISHMSSTLENSLGVIGEEIRAGNQGLVKGIDALHATAKETASNAKERHDRALEMLDNIQRRRKPF